MEVDEPMEAHLVDPKISPKAKMERYPNVSPVNAPIIHNQQQRQQQQHHHPHQLLPSLQALPFKSSVSHNNNNSNNNNNNNNDYGVVKRKSRSSSIPACMDNLGA